MMHTVFFALKRGYWAPLKRFNRMLEDYELTCARYDMLWALGFRRERWQSEIRRVLGIARSTASVMVRALEKLGFVTRTRSPEDGRQRCVSLTEKGRRHLERAYAIRRCFWRVFEFALSPEARRDTSLRFRLMEGAESALEGFASVFNDGGHLQHLDWHPDR